MREVLCGEVRAPVADAGDLLSGAADRVFRGHRGGARYCLAAGELAGPAAFRGDRAGRVHAGSLDDFADAVTDRSGHASRGVCLGVGGAGRSQAAERPADGDRCDDAVIRSANRRRTVLLPLCFQLLGPTPQPQIEPTASPAQQPSPLGRCPKCGGTMVIIQTLTAAQILLRSPPSFLTAA